jgi:hypothetical protein
VSDDERKNVVPKTRLEPPVFLARDDKGPGLAFYTSVEDHVPKLVAHGQVTPGATPWVLTLEPKDVRQLGDFCRNWVLAHMTPDELTGEVDRLKALATSLLDPSEVALSDLPPWRDPLAAAQNAVLVACANLSDADASHIEASSATGAPLSKLGKAIQALRALSPGRAR